MIKLNKVTSKRGMNISPKGHFSLNFVNLLSGAIMTKSEEFAGLILSMLMDRIAPDQLHHYYASLRYPFILSIIYGMNDITEAIRHYYDYIGDNEFAIEAIRALKDTQSLVILDQFIPYLSLDNKIYWILIASKNFDLADYYLDKLRANGSDPYSENTARVAFRFAIGDRNIDKIRYLMKYIIPTQSDINIATKKGFPDVVAVLQGQNIADDDIEDNIEEIQ